MLDLHIHTTASDGTCTPEQVVRMARKKGFSLIAITDHDTMDGVKEALEAGRQNNVEVIPGVEISAGVELEVHILGYGMSPDHPVMVEMMEDMRAARVERMVRMIENLQRSDLNAIEEARGFKNLMRVGNLTQSELADAVSKSRSAVANSLRLLDLPEEIQEYIYEGKITAGHARAILSIPEYEKRLKLAEKIADEKLSVREAESIARLYAAGNMERPVKPAPPRSYKVVAKELKSRFKTPVKVKTTGGKNRIEIEFKDEEDLQRIYQIIKNQM